DLGGGVQGGPREVEPGHRGAAPGPAQRVQADMTHQVQQTLAGYITDLVGLERAQHVPAGQDAVHVVEGAGGVQRHPLVPVRPVEVPPVALRGHFGGSGCLHDCWLPSASVHCTVIVESTVCQARTATNVKASPDRSSAPTGAFRTAKDSWARTSTDRAGALP